MRQKFLGTPLIELLEADHADGPFLPRGHLQRPPISLPAEALDVRIGVGQSVEEPAVQAALHLIALDHSHDVGFVPEVGISGAAKGLQQSLHGRSRVMVPVGLPL